MSDTTPMLPRASLLCITLCLALPACGSDGGSDAEPTKRQCDTSEGQIAFDEPSVLGVSAEQVFQAYLGTQTCTWSWEPPGDHIAELNPQPGDVGAQITLEYTGGPVYSKLDLRPGDESGGLGPCGFHMLEVPMHLEVDTQDGAVSIRGDTIFNLYQVSGTQGLLPLDRSELPGYTFAWSDPGVEETVALSALVDATHTPTGRVVSSLAGALTEQSSRQFDRSHSGASFDSAVWHCD